MNISSIRNHDFNCKSFVLILFIVLDSLHYSIVNGNAGNKTSDKRKAQTIAIRLTGSPQALTLLWVQSTHLCVNVLCIELSIAL